MPSPTFVQIAFHNMPPSPALVARIESEAEKLTHFDSHLVSCRVHVDAPHRHQRRGHHYRIGIELGVPGKKIVVAHEPPARQVLLNDDAARPAKHSEADLTHRDAYVAIRDAFDAARRRLEDAVRRRRDLKRSGKSIRNR